MRLKIIKIVVIKVKITLTIILILILTLPVSAITGYISLEYDTMSSTGQGEVYAEEQFNRLSIGGRMKTNLMGFSLKDGYFPAGVPSSQTYDLVLKYKLTDNIELSLIEGCEHYFVQSGEYKDDEYIKIKTKYSF